MLRTLKRTKMQRTGPRLAPLLLILSIVISIFSLGCAGLKPFPTKDLFEFDAENKVCGQYVVVDEANLKYDWVQDLPLDQCPSIFGFKSNKIPDVLDWAVDAKAYCKQHCR